MTPWRFVQTVVAVIVLTPFVMLGIWLGIVIIGLRTGYGIAESQLRAL